MDLKLNISTDGIATSAIGSMQVLYWAWLVHCHSSTPLNPCLQIISNDPIGKISFAAGGEEKFYQYITYVAKDRRDNRCALTRLVVLSSLTHPN